VTAKAFTAKLACGCVLEFRNGVEGSPVTVVIKKKADACQMAIHVSGSPVFDHREALRPSTRLHPPMQPDYEDN
jgi:hypothetical protein